MTTKFIRVSNFEGICAFQICAIGGFINFWSNLANFCKFRKVEKKIQIKWKIVNSRAQNSTLANRNWSLKSITKHEPQFWVIKGVQIKSTFLTQPSAKFGILGNLTKPSQLWHDNLIHQFCSTKIFSKFWIPNPNYLGLTRFHKFDFRLAVKRIISNFSNSKLIFEVNVTKFLPKNFRKFWAGSRLKCGIRRCWPIGTLF